jgi:tRNA(fMet)-specific endonuclease VapC
MLRSLLDTNLCVRALRDRPAHIRERLKAERETVCISTIVLYELEVGVALSSRPEAGLLAVKDFATSLSVLEFDADAASHAADIRADLTRRGELIGPYDILIAAHARSRGLKVITGNLREFSRVDGLRCEDWL